MEEIKKKRKRRPRKKKNVVKTINKTNVEIDIKKNEDLIQNSINDVYIDNIKNENNAIDDNNNIENIIDNSITKDKDNVNTEFEDNLENIDNEDKTDKLNRDIISSDFGDNIKNENNLDNSENKDDNTEVDKTEDEAINNNNDEPNNNIQTYKNIKDNKRSIKILIMLGLTFVLLFLVFSYFYSIYKELIKENNRLELEIRNMEKNSITIKNENDIKSEKVKDLEEELSDQVEEYNIWLEMKEKIVTALS